MKLFLFWQMSSDSPIFTGFADGASRHTRNLSSAAWVIFSPSGQLVASGGACLGSTMNNIAEYSAVIELLVNAISHGIVHLQVRLDSQLIVSQLNGSYQVRNPLLLRNYLKVRLLERYFEIISYDHIPRSYNHLSDALANYVLDWYLYHS